MPGRSKVLLTLSHPLMLVAAVSTLTLYAGIISTTYPSNIIHFPRLWGCIGIVAGTMGFISIPCRNHRRVLVAAGALLVMASAGRGIAIAESVFLGEQSAAIQRASFVGMAQWWTLAYLIFVLWWRQVLPWTLLDISLKEPKNGH